MSTRAKATSVKIEDNNRVTITEWRFAPGAETGWHQHAHDYVIVYRTPAKHLVETLEGGIMVDVKEGHAYFRKAGVEHNVVNAGDNEVILVETEIK
jgi:quercetin dioxygenase-like cupin family protein